MATNRPGNRSALLAVDVQVGVVAPRATAYAALERSYDLTLIGDGHIAKRLDTGDGTVVEADAIVREFNAVLPWLEYPGRRNRVVSVRDLRAAFEE